MLVFKVRILDRNWKEKEVTEIKADSFDEMRVKARDYAIKNELETKWDNINIEIIERSDGKPLYSNTDEDEWSKKVAQQIDVLPEDVLSPQEKWQKKVGLISKSYKLKKDIVEEFAQACEKSGTSQSKQISVMMVVYIERVNQ